MGRNPFTTLLCTFQPQKAFQKFNVEREMILRGAKHVYEIDPSSWLLNYVLTINTLLYSLFDCLLGITQISSKRLFSAHVAQGKLQLSLSHSLTHTNTSTHVFLFLRFIKIVAAKKWHGNLLSVFLSRQIVS